MRSLARETRACLAVLAGAVLLSTSTCGPLFIGAVASSAGGGGGGGGGGVVIALPTLDVIADAERLACLLITEGSDDDPDERNVLEIVAVVRRDQAALGSVPVRASVTGGQSNPVAFEPADPDNAERGLQLTDGSGSATFAFRAFGRPVAGSNFEILVEAFVDEEKLESGLPIAEASLTVHVVDSITVTGPAVYIDENQNHIADAGDRLIVTVNQKVQLAQPTPPATDTLTLSRAQDEFGDDAVVSTGPITIDEDGNVAEDQTKLTVVLGPSAVLESRGLFPETSGVDLIAGNDLVVTLDGCPASIASALGGTDVVPFFLDSGQDLGVTDTTNGFPTEAGAIGDINRDGYPDYLAANEAVGGPHFVYLNLGAQLPGYFDPSPSLTLQNTRIGQAAALGDLDRDGWLDAVIGVRGTNKYDEVFRFDPVTMGFVSAGILRDDNDFYENGRGGGSDNSRFTEALLLLDVNCDGRLDIVTGGNYGRNSTSPEWGVITWINNGGLGAALDFALGQHLPDTSGSTSGDNQVRQMGAGDLDGDGFLDIVLGREGAARILFFNSTYLEDPLQPAYTIGPAALLNDNARTKAVEVDDFNGDGLNDIALLGSSVDAPPSVLLNDPESPGTFPAEDATILDDEANFQSMALDDIDADGDLDIVGGRGANFPEVNVAYLNDGLGRFCTVDQSGTCSIDRVEFVSSGDTTDPSVTTNKSGFLGAADLDLDGDVDLIEGVRGRKNSFVIGDRVYMASLSGTWGEAMFSVFETSLAPTNSHVLALGDFNRDGRVDLAVGNDGVNEIKINQGGTSFSDSASFAFGNNDDTRALAAIDLNCNGLLDLVEGNFDTASGSTGAGGTCLVHFDFDEASGRFMRTIDLGNAVIGTTSIAVIDFNRDGLQDLILGIQGGLNLAYRNDGRGADGYSTFTPDPAFDFNEPTENQTRALAVGDFDRNGYLDVIEGTASHNFLWSNDGTGFTIAKTFDNNATETLSLAVGDLNKDGFLDFVAGNLGESEAWLADPLVPGEFVLGASFDSTHLQTNSVVLADLEADGDLDVVGGTESGPIQVYRNDGTGVLGLTDTLVPDAVRSIVGGDVDRDGDVDLVAGRFARPIVIVEND